MSTGYAALYNATYFGLVVVAGRIAGGVIAFQISFALAMLPVAIGAVPLAAAQLPRLARSFDQKNTMAFDYTYRRSLALVLFVSLPAGLLYFTMSETLARAVAFGQMATTTGVSVIASCIGSLGLATIGEAAFNVSTSALYARRDALRPLWAMAIRAVIAFTGMGVALIAMDGTAVLWTLGLTVAAANLAAAAYLYRCLIRGQPKVSRYEARSILGELVASAISMAPGVFFAIWFEDSVGNRYQNIGVAAAAITISAACYLTIQWMRGSGELKLLLSVIQSTILFRPSDKMLRTGYVVEKEDPRVGPS
jgi:putative peptidoglycan lipid II flippase